MTHSKVVEICLPVEGHWYVAHQSGKSVYKYPSVSSEKVSDSLAEDWLFEGQQLIVWSSRMAAVNAVDSKATNQDIDERLAGVRNKVGVSTPSPQQYKTPQSDEEEDDYSPSVLFKQNHVDRMRSGVEAWRQGSTITDDFVEGSFGVCEMLKTIGAEVPELRETIGGDLVKLSVRLGQVEASQCLMEGQLETVGAQDLIKTREETARMVKLATATEVSKLEGRVKSQVAKLEEGMGKLGPWARELRTSANDSAGRVTDLKWQVTALEATVNQLQAELLQATESRAFGSQPRAVVGGADLEALKEEQQLVSSLLAERLERVEMQVNVTGSTFGGIDLDSPTAVLAWVEKNMPDGRFGTVLDFVSFFQHLYTHFTDMTTDLTQMTQLEKLKFPTAHEASIATSFTNVLPAVLGRDSDFSKPLPALGTPEKWSQAHDRTGLKHVIEDQMASIKAKIMSQIPHMETQEGMILARCCLEATCAFVATFSSFFSDLHTNLHATGGYDKHASWMLTCRIGRRIFDEMAEVRVCGKGSRVINDPRATTARYLTGILRTHLKMEEFTKARFENHPVLSSEYVKFFATNSSTAKIELMSVRLAALEKEKLADKKALDAMSSKWAAMVSKGK